MLDGDGDGKEDGDIDDGVPNVVVDHPESDADQRDGEDDVDVATPARGGIAHRLDDD